MNRQEFMKAFERLSRQEQERVTKRLVELLEAEAEKQEQAQIDAVAAELLDDVDI